MGKMYTDVRSKNAGSKIAECYDCGSDVFELVEYIDRRQLVCADCGRVYAENDEQIDKLLKGAREFEPWEE